MATNLTRIAGNVLSARCGVHGIVMYQKTVSIPGLAGGYGVAAPVWVCAACEVERELKAGAKNAGSN